MQTERKGWQKLLLAGAIISFTFLCAIDLYFWISFIVIMLDMNSFADSPVIINPFAWCSYILFVVVLCLVFGLIFLVFVIFNLVALILTVRCYRGLRINWPALVTFTILGLDVIGCVALVWHQLAKRQALKMTKL